MSSKRSSVHRCELPNKTSGKTSRNSRVKLVPLANLTKSPMLEQPSLWPCPLPPATELENQDIEPSCSTSLKASTSALKDDVSSDLSLPSADSRVPSLGKSSNHRRRPGERISSILNYGSEEDTDTDDAGDEDAPVVNMAPLIARTIREAHIWDNLDNLTPPEPEPVSESSPPTDSLKPTDLFEFDWTYLPEPPLDPNMRREPFTAPHTGPRAAYDTPYDAFVAVWDASIMEYICRQTNIYAQQYVNAMMLSGELRLHSRISNWQDISIDELYTYFAIILAMGIIVSGRTDEYWSTEKDIFYTPGFKASMSRNRFQLITSLLHFNDNENIVNASLHRSQAKQLKIQPLVDHLNLKFSQLYDLGSNIVLDESLMRWKGMLYSNQFVDNKAAATAIKTYELCEVQTGYLWRFELHTDSEPLQDSGPTSEAMSSLVLRLLQGLDNKGHTIWMDHFYNSPALARVLKSRGFDCVGTLRTNRKFVPAELTTLLKTDLAENYVFGSTSGDVDLLVWRDRNRVVLISTYHGAAVSLGPTGLLRPAALHDYNIAMMGVAKKDQMLSAYPIERNRTRAWYKELFRRLLNVSVLNAYIMLKHRKNIEHRTFRKTLITQILKRHCTDQVKVIDLVEDDKRMKYTQQIIGHMPQPYVALPGRRIRKPRRNCKVCGQRTHYHCPTCDVPICYNPEKPAKDNCFFKYHT